MGAINFLPVEITFQHRGKPLTLRLREHVEDVDTTSFGDWTELVPDADISWVGWLLVRLGLRRRRFVVRQTGTGAGMFKESIVGIRWLEGEVVGPLPDDWHACDDYRIDAPEFQGTIRIRDGARPEFRSQGVYSVPALGIPALGSAAFVAEGPT